MYVWPETPMTGHTPALLRLLMRAWLHSLALPQNDEAFLCLSACGLELGCQPIPSHLLPQPSHGTSGAVAVSLLFSADRVCRSQF